MKSSANVAQWTLAHDATTIGGNSGSVVLVAGRERVAAGLHYGGRRGEPRENWGHVIGRVLDEKDHRSGATLRQLFIEYGVRLVDRN
jgi:V8-like Glu-specific endopeptidase